MFVEEREEQWVDSMNPELPFYPSLSSLSLVPNLKNTSISLQSFCQPGVQRIGSEPRENQLVGQLF